MMQLSCLSLLRCQPLVLTLLNAIPTNMKICATSSLALACFSVSISAFSTRTVSFPPSSTRLYADAQQDAFAAFADSLEEDTVVVEEEKVDESWQERLEMLLDPLTPLAQRQVLMSELMASNEDIRNSVTAALRDRKIDPLLTPMGKKLQDGTRAVARQLTTDILPDIARAARSPPPPDLQAVPKIGSRILNAISSQAKKTMQDFSQDIRDPFRIPQRLSQQTEDLAKEAKNVFLETPEGLVGPEYTVVKRGEGYEIRDYVGYTVASTNMGEGTKMTDVTSSGAAFNALAAYLFGANEESRAMTMTTPVTTTSLGEMRFYLQEESPAAPLEDGKTGMYEAGAVQIVDIPAARLAVRRFTGFVTEGEVARQKDALLSQLEMDGMEIDVPHGAVVPHVIFQYNPPYTIPMVRRNEIAVPVREAQATKDLEKEWGQDDDNAGNLSPSDVE